MSTLRIKLFVQSGTAPIIDESTIVIVNGLKCGETYTIIAGGTINGALVGPRSSHGTISTNPCPVCPVIGKIHHSNN